VARAGRALIAGGLFGAGAAIVAAAIVAGMMAPDQGWWVLVPEAGLAAALCAAPAWALLIGGTGPLPGRGALAGAWVGAASHPVLWVLFEIGSSRPFDVVTWIYFLVLGFALTGWITVPAAALLGALLGWLLPPRQP
jgi:hypothetical protein